LNAYRGGRSIAGGPAKVIIRTLIVIRKATSGLSHDFRKDTSPLRQSEENEDEPKNETHFFFFLPFSFFFFSFFFKKGRKR
jgi:hypothetical protein